MIVLVGLVEAGITRLPVSGPIAWSWRSSAEMIATEAAHRDVLCFGDSMMKCGIAAELFERRLGWTSYNFAVVRSQPRASEALLRRALARGAKPAAILVDFFPGLLADPPGLNAGEWAEILAPSEIIGLAIAARDPWLPPRAFASWILPSHTARADLRQYAVAMLGMSATTFETRLSRERRERVAQRGTALQPTEGGCNEILPPQGRGRPRGIGWRCRPEHEQSIRRFLALASASGAKVYWLLPPLSPASQARRDQNGLERAARAFVKRFQAEYPALIVLDGSTLKLDNSAFRDSNHVNARGALILTAAVADELERAAKATPTTWVALAAPKSPPADSEWNASVFLDPARRIR